MLRRSNVAMAVASVFNNLVRWAAVCIIVAYVYYIVASLAGKQTEANIVVSFLGNLTVSQSIAYIFGAGGVVYGLGERRLRQKTVKHVQPRVQQLEASKDPGRTSSKLTPTGETNPVDRE